MQPGTTLADYEEVSRREVGRKVKIEGFQEVTEIEYEITYRLKQASKEKI